MDPQDERDAFWKAVHTVDDRVTTLESIVNTRNEMMRESIADAVRAAMPSALLSDDEHRWVKMAIEREAERSAFRRKVIESSVVWAVPTLIGGMLWILWRLIVEFAYAHGWKG